MPQRRPASCRPRFPPRVDCGARAADGQQGRPGVGVRARGTRRGPAPSRRTLGAERMAHTPGLARRGGLSAAAASATASAPLARSSRPGAVDSRPRRWHSLGNYPALAAAPAAAGRGRARLWPRRPSGVARGHAGGRRRARRNARAAGTFSVSRRIARRGPPGRRQPPPARPSAGSRPAGAGRGAGVGEGGLGDPGRSHRLGPREARSSTVSATLWSGSGGLVILVFSGSGERQSE